MSQIKLEVTNIKQILNNQTTDLMKKLEEKTAECQENATENARLLTDCLVKTGQVEIIGPLKIFVR